MKRTIWIARHGNRQDFVDPEWHRSAENPYDPPLSPDGLLQARELGMRMQREQIDHLFSSPYLRCVQTADQVARVLNLPIKIEEGLAEWLNPEWFSEHPQAMPLENLAQQFEYIDSGYPSCTSAIYPEDVTQVFRRMEKTMRYITEEFEGQVLLIGHGATVQGAAAGLLGLSPEEEELYYLLPQIPCCSLVKLVSQSSTWSIELRADTSHLRDSRAGNRFF